MSGPISWAIGFAGGIFGAAFGAMPAFILCGLAAIIGVAVKLITGSDDFTANVTWGPLLGPQASFAGGVAAAAYAARRGLHGSGRNICDGLMGLDAPDVLLVGGIFGALGQALVDLFNMVPPIAGQAWTNTIALSIVVTQILARVLFGRTGPLGRVAPGASRWKNSAQASWLPWQSQPAQLLLIGIGVGLPAAALTAHRPEMLFFMFGIGTISLIFLQYGTKIPVTHHVALSAELFASVTGDLAWGAAMGIITAFSCEFFASLFLKHGDSHIDPPTCSLVLAFSLMPLCAASGWLKHSGAWPLAFVVIGGAALSLRPLLVRNGAVQAKAEEAV